MSKRTRSVANAEPTVEPDRRATLDDSAAISLMVDLFYEQVLADDRLRPLFIDVAGINLNQHLPHIRQYWCKLLLGDRGYQRHTMNIHRNLNAKQPLSSADFERWLGLFCQNIHRNFTGKNAQKAINIAQAIAGNMQKSLDND